MSSRERILAAVQSNQPPAIALPDIDEFKGTEAGMVSGYGKVFACPTPELRNH